MVIRAVFFDFDGTISDARKIAEDSLVLTLNEFGFKYNKKKALGLLGIHMDRILKKLGLGGEDVEEVRKRFYRHFTRMAMEGGIRPCVSLKPLWDLKEEVPLFVVSNSRGSFLKASIKKLNLRGLFVGVYGGEKFESKDEFLRYLFKKLKIRPSEAVYVGDRFSDVEFAREAGCVAVAIHNKCSWSSLSRIKLEKPDYVVRDFYGLRKVLRELNKD